MNNRTSHSQSDLIPILRTSPRPTSAMIGATTSQMNIPPHLLAILHGLLISSIPFDPPAIPLRNTFWANLPPSPTRASLAVRYLRRVAEDSEHGLLATLATPAKNDGPYFVPEVIRTIGRILNLLQKDELAENDWEQIKMADDSRGALARRHMTAFCTLDAASDMLRFLGATDPFL